MIAFALTYAVVGAFTASLTLWMGLDSGYVRAFGWKSLWLGMIGAFLLWPRALPFNLRAIWTAHRGDPQ